MPPANEQMSENRISNERVTSADGNTSIEVVKRADGNFSLKMFALRYDSEEEVHYEVRVMPDPGGIFGGIDLAVEEAQRLISL